MGIIDDAYNEDSSTQTIKRRSIIDDAYNEVETSPEGQDKSLGRRLYDRGSNIVKEFTNPTTFDVTDAKGNIVKVPEARGDVLHVMGQVAGGINDVVGAAAKGIYNTVMPEYGKGIIEEGTKAGTPVGDASRGIGQGIQKGMSYLPEEGRKNAEDIMNIAGAVPIVKGAVGAVQGGKALYKTAGQAITSQADKAIANKPYSWLANTEANYNKQLKDIVSEHYPAAASPTTVGKRSWGKIKSANDNQVKATELIIKDSLSEGKSIPQTLEEATETVGNSITNRMQTSHTLAQQGSDVRVAGKKTIQNIRKEYSNTNRSPEVRQQAEDMIKWIEENPARTPVEIEIMAKDLNAKAKMWHKTGNSSAGELAAKTSKELREEMLVDMGNGGEQWQMLRNEVRDLYSVQDDIAKSYGVDLRKKKFGFMDLGNMYSMGELAQGIATMNPVLIAKAGSISAAKAYMKHINSKNVQIAKMFSKAEKVIGRRDKIKGIIQGLERQGPDPSSVKGVNAQYLEGNMNPNIPKQIGYEKGLPQNYSNEVPTELLGTTERSAVTGQSAKPPYREPSKQIGYSEMNRNALTEQPLPDTTAAMNPKGIGLKKPLKLLDAQTAQQIMKEARGDKNKAREIAKKRGFKI